MLSKRLKQETRQPHLDLEKLIIPQIKNIQTTTDYQQLLQVFYGYYRPVEDAINQHLNESHIHDFAARRKAEVILEDLKQIGTETANSELCKDIPTVTNSAKALGVMYVLEGSTLGGKIISKMIINSLQLQSDLGVRFFSGYGPETEEKWNSFKNYLDNYTNHPAVEEDIITAANETFIKFKKWIEVN